MLKSVRLFGALAVVAFTPVDSLVAQTQHSPPASTVSAPEIGMPVFSLDGQKIGTVESINATADGKPSAINITTGSILGFGAKSVAIPISKFTLKDHYVRVEMTSDDVAMLPHQGP